MHPRQMAPNEVIKKEISKVKDYLLALSEPQFQKILRYYMEDTCGWAKVYQSPSEHGLDIAALIESDKDVFRRECTVLIQAKVGDLGLPKWTKNIAGQMTQLYSKKIERSKFNPHNPRRILLITSGELKPEVESAVFEWNEKQPLPIEVFEGNDIAEALIEKYGNVDEVKKILQKEEPIFYGEKKSTEVEPQYAIGKEDAVFID